MKSIPLYKFYKHKYGNELLIDVIDIDVMKADISQTSVYCTSFYSIILFMDGAEDIAINGQKQCVEKRNGGVFPSGGYLVMVGRL